MTTDLRSCSNVSGVSGSGSMAGVCERLFGPTTGHRRSLTRLSVLASSSYPRRHQGRQDRPTYDPLMRRRRRAPLTPWLALLTIVLGASCTSARLSATSTNTTKAAQVDTSSTYIAASTTLVGPTTTTPALTTTTSVAAPSVTEVPPPAKTCGVERWAVKTGMDSDAVKVNQANVVPSSVGALTALSAPSNPTARVAPTETTVFSIHATLTKFKMETDDSDYHLILDDGQGHTLIAEMPSADCIGSSPFKTAIGDVRAVVFTRFHPGPSFRATRANVTVTGVGFFDRVHGQTGVAPNGIELHPVLSIAFD